MGEETKDPKRTVPIAMFWSIAANVLMGLFSLITWLVSDGSTDSIDAEH